MIEIKKINELSEAHIDPNIDSWQHYNIPA